jgi:Phage tail sheath C-terminal domain
MRIPSISFNEANVGLSPIRTGIRNRIGIVGLFSRGPSNAASFVTGYTDFANRYGSDTATGSLAYQAAYDQGARDFCNVRVLGNAKAAKGQVTFSGIASKDNTLFFNIKFIGEVQEITDLQTIVTTSGKYTGVLSGRYHFKVTNVSVANVATIKYTFVALTADESLIDWTAVSSFITVDLTADQGVAKAVSTTGISVTFGQVADVGNIVLVLNDSFKLRVSSYVYSIPVNQNDTPSQIATSFIDSISGREPIGEVIRDSADTGVVFELDPEAAGAIGNKYSYYFTLADTVSPGIATANPVLLVANSVFMQGGENGPRNAFRDLYSLSGVPLLRLVAVSEGAWGNQLRFTLYPLNNKQFRFSIYDLSGSNFNPKLAAESYTLDFANTSQDGSLNQLANSIYVRGLFLPKFTNPLTYDAGLISQSPQRLAPPSSLVTDVENTAHPNYYGPSKLIDVSLENGYDGPPVTEEDYVKGIQKLESFPVHIVIAPGTYNSQVIQTNLIAHAEKASDKDGLRIAVLSARPNLSPNAAKQETVGLESRRAVKVVGWTTYAGQPNTSRYALSADALYAGKLASIPFYAGPNARRTAGTVFNVTEVDTKNNANSEALQLYTDAKLEILTIDGSSQAFVFTNGRTLSSDTSWDKIYIRRTYDFIRQDLYDLLTQYLGEPHTSLIRRQIASAINGYMGELSRNSQIANYRNAVLDSSNNSPENYINGQLNINVEFLPLYSIDYITITLIRNTNDGLVTFGN